MNIGRLVTCRGSRHVVAVSNIRHSAAATDQSVAIAHNSRPARLREINYAMPSCSGRRGTGRQDGAETESGETAGGGSGEQCRASGRDSIRTIISRNHTLNPPVQRPQIPSDYRTHRPTAWAPGCCCCWRRPTARNADSRRRTIRHGIGVGHSTCAHYSLPLAAGFLSRPSSAITGSICAVGVGRLRGGVGEKRKINSSCSFRG